MYARTSPVREKQPKLREFFYEDIQLQIQEAVLGINAELKELVYWTSR